MAAGVKDYIKAVSHEVVPAISRGLTRIKVIAHIVAGIVYLALGLHFELPTPWIVGGALAIAALELLLIVPYRLWARLTEQVTHRLILKCMVDEPGCVRRDVPLRLNNGGQIEATWFRLKVFASGTINIVGCCAHLTSIRRAGENENLLDGESVVCPFTPATDADAEKKTIRPTHPAYVDVITANTSNGIIWLYPTHRDATINWKAMFAKAGKFNLTIALTSDNSAPCTADLEFDWTGDPAESSLSLISQNPPA